MKVMLGFLLMLMLPGMALAQVNPLSVEQVSAADAYRHTTDVAIFPGRTSLIDFRTDEMIAFVQVSDPEYILYSLNAPIESGQARSILVRLSEGIEFQYLTESATPNLIVTTITRAGESRTYAFDLVRRTGLPAAGDTNGIAIVEQVETAQNAINTRLGPATLDDLEQGLALSIKKRYTAANDPIVRRVRDVLAHARNGGVLLQLAEANNIPISVLTALGEIALEDRSIPVLINRGER
jgi:hypothetical protein